MYIFEIIFLFLFCNLVPLRTETGLPFALKLLCTVGLSGFYLWEIFHSENEPSGEKRLKRIYNGCRIVRHAGITAAAETLFLIFYIIFSGAGTVAKIFSAVMPVLALGVILFAGAVKIAVSARQIKLKNHALMLMLWWCPVVNLMLIRNFYKTAKTEYLTEYAKIELENARAENEICKTKYPVIMVHGIFFRDWQLISYWGRIPASLIRNGAEIYYGGQQSAQPLQRSAAELKNTIMKVLKETGAEKVNIIAHSKGGLDARYAISCLGMDKYVATLTTINTPHKGCDMVDFLLKKLPDSLIDFLEKRYNSIFTKLGDTTPDFLGGVKDLGAERAKSYDSLMPDSPKVYYKSFMSLMRSAGSAGIPMNIGYMLIKRLNGANDGLVSEESARHGEYELITVPGKRGISHGDVIDLMRENISGYDVREFYVSLVSLLKERGY